ncbi:pseudouridine synthase [Reinekea sp.]|jgi:tRNA pseudouridine32 synthase/23S rRNA pseudouridine746 synthase|uniref:pseudouridine synthase n=1 Tax=Reinekea sp. TaxID=1970455 RepID=UPI00398989DA
MKIDAVLEVEAGDPQILIEFLLSNVNLSKSRLKDVMSKGGIWRVDKKGERSRVRRAMTDILVGEQIEIFYDEALMGAKPLHAELIEDYGQYSVWQKPFGMPFEGDDWGDYNSFIRNLSFAFDEPRDTVLLSSLDYSASGLVLIPHTRKAAAAISESIGVDFIEDSAVHYRVDVAGNIEDLDRINIDIAGEKAITNIEKVKYDERPNRSVVDVWPQTGRVRQVRSHFQAIGHPIIGDIDPEGELDDSVRLDPIRLKLVELTFLCPVTKVLKSYSTIGSNA